MAFGDTIQSVQNSVASGGSLTVTFSAAVAGNLLIFGVGVSAAATWGSDPSGWTTIHSVPDGSGDMSGRWYYKIAAGGETSVTVTITETTPNIRGAMAEFEGAFTASPLDVKAENEAGITPTQTSLSTGTTGTTAQADELAVAYWAMDRADAVTDGRAYTNSFTEVIFASATLNATRAAVAIAKKVLSATGTVECTFSTTDTGDEMYGSVATFKKETGGGGAAGPLIDGHLVKHGILQGRLVRA